MGQEPITIKICMGSACHLKGAPLVAQAFQEALNRCDRQQVAKIQLTGDFCQHQCLEGVIVKVGDQIFTKVTPVDAGAIVSQILGDEGHVSNNQ